MCHRQRSRSAHEFRLASASSVHMDSAGVQLEPPAKDYGNTSSIHLGKETA